MPRYAATVDITHLPGHPRSAGRDDRPGAPGARLRERDPGEGRQDASGSCVDADSEDAARAQVDEMCHRLLANPVIEAFEISLESA